MYFHAHYISLYTVYIPYFQRIEEVHSYSHLISFLKQEFFSNFSAILQNMQHNVFEKVELPLPLYKIFKILKVFFQKGENFTFFLHNNLKHHLP